MKRYNIGLDFGTYQTKACVLDIENDTHEFFKFPVNNSYFLLSKISVTKHGTFEYGKNDVTSEKDFYYFKIASAEDVEFRIETFEKTNQKDIYNAEDFTPYTPEFLSVCYITFILFTIKDVLKDRQTTQQGKGLLGRLLSQNSDKEETDFSIQLGIPTEWSQIKNLRRKRKFENVLMISELLQVKYKTKENFLKATVNQLIIDVKHIYSTIPFSNLSEFNNKLNQLKISIFPETAAALAFILKTKQLQIGYYAIMDIGGGSTDISFFAVQGKHQIKYFASESYIIASNNVYQEYKKNRNLDESLHQAEEEARSAFERDLVNDDEVLIKSINTIKKSLNKLVYKLFYKRVQWFQHSMRQRYDDQQVIVYGGGSRLPGFDSGSVLICDSGSRHSVTIPQYNMHKEHIDNFTFVLNILPADGSWKKNFCVLVVALGLSYIKPDNLSSWFGDDDYHSTDGSDPTGGIDPVTKPGRDGHQIPHPFNEDCFIFDVLASKWKY